ncbi:MAG: hypothetical protein K2H29_12695 [Oscillospiraceae bacterium]|nr:hypothetical protein [Oscillospiraceae bacterium]
MEENNNEVAVSAPEVTILSDRHNMAVMLDKSIKSHALIAQQSLYEVCKGLKEMRDGKLYKELGYQNFEDYCENEVGVKRHQARKYIMIAESLSKNFVESTHQIGTEKLVLLAKLDESDRKQIQQETDIESTTVKELKEKIKDLKRQHSSELDDQKDHYEKKLQELEQQRENLSIKYQFDKQAHRRELNEAKEKSEFLAAHITELEKQIQELEDRPVEVMQSTAELEEIERLKSELEETRSREQEAKAEAEIIQNANVKTTSKIERLQTRISELEKQPVSGAEPDAKELFRPYFQACTHSIGLMMDFVGKQKNSPDFAFLTSKASQIAEVIQKQLQALKNQSE